MTATNGLDEATAVGEMYETIIDPAGMDFTRFSLRDFFEERSAWVRQWVIEILDDDTWDPDRYICEVFSSLRLKPFSFSWPQGILEVEKGAVGLFNRRQHWRPSFRVPVHDPAELLKFLDRDVERDVHVDMSLTGWIVLWRDVQASSPEEAKALFSPFVHRFKRGTHQVQRTVELFNQALPYFIHTAAVTIHEAE